MRRFGSAALDLAYVAAGRFDGYWELGINGTWPRACSWCGRRAGSRRTPGAGPLASGDVVAANPALHPRLLAAVVEGVEAARDRIPGKGKRHDPWHQRWHPGTPRLVLARPCGGLLPCGRVSTRRTLGACPGERKHERAQWAGADAGGEARPAPGTGSAFGAGTPSGDSGADGDGPASPAPGAAKPRRPARPAAAGVRDARGNDDRAAALAAARAPAGEPRSRADRPGRAAASGADAAAAACGRWRARQRDAHSRRASRHLRRRWCCAQPGDARRTARDRGKCRGRARAFGFGRWLREERSLRPLDGAPALALAGARRAGGAARGRDPPERVPMCAPC